MKFRTTRKAIAEGTARNDLYQCGYCDMAHLLRNHSPIAYTCGIYGWNFDVYSVYGLTITTGYRNMCGKQIPFDILRSYEIKARDISNDWNIPYQQKSEAIEALLIEFVNTLKGE